LKPYLLEETNLKNVKVQKYEIAVIQWGATEAHNYHLPYGTDIIETEYIASKSVKTAWNKGAKIILLPIIPFGVNTTQIDIPLTINMNPSTQMKLLQDIISSLVIHNIRKIVILNGHGGNEFKQLIRELYLIFPNTFICQLNWFQVVNPGDYFEDTGEHAGEWETSMMLKIAPGLVLPLNEAGDGKNKKLKFKDSGEHWVWAPRPWSKITSDTGIGNPVKATLDKGEHYLNDVISKISHFFIELSQIRIDDLYS